MELIDIFDRHDSLGLEYSAKTGGHFVPSLTQRLVHTSDSIEEYEIVDSEGKKTPILDGRVFLKSVTTTEDALKIKLFV